MIERSLNLDAVQAFVLVADLCSFTRAAEVLGTTQSAVSLQVKRLEERVGRRLVERTPRVVRLSASGAAFVERARDLLAAHERALSKLDLRLRPLRIGISEHIANAELPLLLARLKSYDPTLTLEVRIGLSRDLLDAFDQRTLDAVIVRRESEPRGGEKLFEDRFGWFASPNWRHREGEKLPLATLAAPCAVRSIATRLLDAAGIPWTEAFVGGGIAAVAAAVAAGLGVAPLARRVAPPGVIEIAQSLALPPLPLSAVILHSAVSDARAEGAIRTLAAAFRASSNAG